MDDFPSSLCTVILERSSPLPVAETGRVLSAVLGLQRADATSRARYGGGLLAAEIEEPVAARLVEELAAIGVRARAIDAAGWGLSPPGYQTVAIEFLEDSLLARLQNDTELVVPVEDVFALDAYCLTRAEAPQEESRGKGRRSTGAARGAAASMALTADTTLSARGRTLLDNLSAVGPPGVELRATIYCAEPAGPLHLRKDRFDYGVLGPRKQPHSLDNYLLLLETLVERFPAAWNRESVGRFLTGLDISGIHRFRREEVETFHRWIQHWIAVEVEGRGER